MTETLSERIPTMSKYNVSAPKTPGATPSVIAGADTLRAARREAKAFRAGRRDLHRQDVRIEREDGSLVEYAGGAS